MRICKLLCLILALALLLSACGKEEAESTIELLPEQNEAETTEQAAQADDGKTESTFGLSYLPAYGLNPFTCTATANRALFSLLYENLFVVSNQFRAEPVLCKSFKVSGEGTMYTFTLVDGVKFSDGTPLTIDDVAASIDAARVSPLYKGRLSRISYYVVNEDGSITVVLSAPYENFALMMDIPIVKAASVESQTPVGTGAYRLSGSVLIRNQHWWKTTPDIDLGDRILLSPCTEPIELRDNFEFGATDLVYSDPNSAAAAGYRCDYEVWDVPTTVMHYIGFNLGSGYFVNDTLRTAVTFALDREEIANTIYHGYALASPLPCSPNSDLYDAQLAEDYDYSPARFATAVQASEVLTSESYVGHVGRLIVCSEDPVRVTAAEAVAETLVSAGLSITVVPLERDSYLRALQNGDFDLYYGEVRLTANFDLTEFFNKYGNLQYGSIANSAMADLCVDALANSGSYLELCSQLLTQAQICPVVFKSNAIFVTRGSLSTIAPAVDFIFHDPTVARTLSDADQTYADVAPVEPSGDPTEESSSE